MEPIMDWIIANAILLAAIGAFSCGVALFYLVMARTLKHRKKQAEG